MKQPRCPDCGGKLRKVYENWKCEQCGDFFDDGYIKKKSENRDLNEVWK